MITVLIVADDWVYRGGIRSLLQGSKGIRILGTSSSEDAPERVAAKHPDVVLLAVATAGRPSVIKAILDSSPQTNVIVVGVESDEAAILSWIVRGACGYTTQRATKADLLLAIADAAEGKLHCSPTVARMLTDRVHELASSQDGHGLAASLTAREKEIANLLRLRLSNKEIARRLNIEESTVKSHVHNILGKADEHSRTKAVAHLE